jgi:hypothetical protein
MANSLVPYNHQGFALDLWPQQKAVKSSMPGWNGIHFDFNTQDLPFLKSKIEAWFGGRNEIIYVDDGDCAKQDLSFIVMEWENCEIDQLFLAILDDEDRITSYSVYFRAADDYE